MTDIEIAKARIRAYLQTVRTADVAAASGVPARTVRHIRRGVGNHWDTTLSKLAAVIPPEFILDHGTSHGSGSREAEHIHNAHAGNRLPVAGDAECGCGASECAR